jgi:hypothetical protein
MRLSIASAIFTAAILSAGCQSLPEETGPRFAIALVGVQQAAKSGGFDFDPAALGLGFLAPGYMKADANGGCVLAGALHHEAVAVFRTAARMDITGSAGAQALILVSESKYIGISPLPETEIVDVSSRPAPKPIPKTWRGDLALHDVRFEGDDGDPNSPMGVWPKSPFSFTVDGQSKYLDLFFSPGCRS